MCQPNYRNCYVAGTSSRCWLFCWHSSNAKPHLFVLTRTRAFAQSIAYHIRIHISFRIWPAFGNPFLEESRSISFWSLTSLQSDGCLGSFDVHSTSLFHFTCCSGGSLGICWGRFCITFPNLGDALGTLWAALGQPLVPCWSQVWPLATLTFRRLQNKDC